MNVSQGRRISDLLKWGVWGGARLWEDQSFFRWRGVSVFHPWRECVLPHHVLCVSRKWETEDSVLQWNFIYRSRETFATILAAKFQKRLSPEQSLRGWKIESDLFHLEEIWYLWKFFNGSFHGEMCRRTESSRLSISLLIESRLLCMITIHSYDFSRCFSDIFWIVKYLSWKIWWQITAPATTGPAKHPRPASWMPAMGKISVLRAIMAKDFRGSREEHGMMPKELSS